jgi:hypothetical protein
VDEGGGDVKREKPKQPKDNQNCGNYSKHVFISYLSAATRNPFVTRSTDSAFGFVLG